MIICICGLFDIYDENMIPTGEKEFVVSHGLDSVTLEPFVLPSEHPFEIGAFYNSDIGEWVLEGSVKVDDPAY